LHGRNRPGGFRFEANDLFDADILSATVVAQYLLPDVNLRLGRARLSVDDTSARRTKALRKPNDMP
jgi:hypothetical protein